MTHPAATISRRLAHATDALLLRAVDALEAGGADFSAASDRHPLIIPGARLRDVGEALKHWTTISCEQDACDNWTVPQAKVSQAIYQLVDNLFDPALGERGGMDDGSRPLMVSGESLMALQDTREAWANAWKPPRRLSPR